MNNLDTVQLVVNLVAIPVAVISVILLIWQARQLDDTLKSQVYQGLIDNSLKIDQLLIDNPEFRKYVYEREEIDESMQDIDKLMAVLDFVVDVIDNVKAQERFIPKAALPGWRAFVQDVLDQPSIKYYMTRKGYWYYGTLTQSNLDPKSETHKES